MNGIKVGLPLMQFDDDECLIIYKKLKFEYDVFWFVYTLQNVHRMLLRTQ